MLRIIVTALATSALAALGCGHLAAAPRPVASAGLAAPPAELPAELRALEPALARHAVVMFGELHGTTELPAFVGEVVAALASRGKVVLALEIPITDQADLERFVASDGTAAARAELLAGPFWSATYQDGRRSVAMLHLLERVRQLRAGGAAIEAFAFDVPDFDRGERDRGMADNLLRARAAEPDATWVLLAGDLHVVRGEHPMVPGKRWMAGHVIDAGVPVVSLQPWHAGGSAWVCTDDVAAHCGPREGPGRAAGARGVVLEPSSEGAYDGRYVVGPITASPPAIGATAR